MESEKPPSPAQQLIVFWVLWLSFLVGVCVQYHFLHSKEAVAPDESQQWLAALAPVLVSMILRWNVLPRITEVQKALTVMVVGVALAESAMFIGIFIFAAHQWELFLAAFFGIAQHAPVYVAKLLNPPPQD